MDESDLGDLCSLATATDILFVKSIRSPIPYGALEMIEKKASTLLNPKSQEKLGLIITRLVQKYQQWECYTSILNTRGQWGIAKDIGIDLKNVRDIQVHPTALVIYSDEPQCLRNSIAYAGTFPHELTIDQRPEQNLSDILGTPNRRAIVARDEANAIKGLMVERYALTNRYEEDTSDVLADSSYRAMGAICAILTFLQYSKNWSITQLEMHLAKETQHLQKYLALQAENTDIEGIQELCGKVDTLIEKFIWNPFDQAAKSPNADILRPHYFVLGQLLSLVTLDTAHIAFDAMDY